MIEKQKEEMGIVPKDQDIIDIPMMPIKQLAKLTAYVNNVKKTLMEKGKDYIIDGNRQYTARSGFAKLHQGFFLSDGHAVTKTIYYDEPQEFTFTHKIYRKEVERTISTRIYGFEAMVTVINTRTGRYASGEGACTLEELHQTHNMTPKWYHRLLATAKTRAWNRAVSNYVGSAEVSAEELGLTYGDENDHEAIPPERKPVESSQKAVTAIPANFETPDWSFREEVGTQGWEDVENGIETWLSSSGWAHPREVFEFGHDPVKAYIKNASGVFFGDNWQVINSNLSKAGFEYSKTEKRWRFLKEA